MGEVDQFLEVGEEVGKSFQGIPASISQLDFTAHRYSSIKKPFHRCYQLLKEMLNILLGLRVSRVLISFKNIGWPSQDSQREPYGVWKELPCFSKSSQWKNDINDDAGAMDRYFWAEEAQGQFNNAGVWVVTRSQGREELLGGRKSQQCHIVRKSRAQALRKPRWSDMRVIMSPRSMPVEERREPLDCSGLPGRGNFYVKKREG